MALVLLLLSLPAADAADSEGVPSSRGSGLATPPPMCTATPISVRTHLDGGGEGSGGEEDRTRSVPDAVLGDWRTGCGMVGPRTRETAGQSA